MLPMSRSAELYLWGLCLRLSFAFEQKQHHYNLNQAWQSVSAKEKIIERPLALEFSSYTPDAQGIEELSKLSFYKVKFAIHRKENILRKNYKLLLRVNINPKASFI